MAGAWTCASGGAARAGDPEAAGLRLASSVMVGLVPTIHVLLQRMPCSRRGCSPQGRA
ncbi:hypothetical protein BOS5A_230294 [Bosea sp. EC-HK365B]|nr:hypothetical protein BOSE21B_90371 [Bosea sp. 21B]CAD5298041.1 hypothetical protein BOSE7B_60297 [Bosea sp. 7B]VVT61017.1 hypothetical protein BOS5A_230294 [Bosea sp. EC-HK365B]VXB32443.1 hypothetical protein BOSE127_110295 [Bosea sp. 127]